MAAAMGEGESVLESLDMEWQERGDHEAATPKKGKKRKSDGGETGEKLKPKAKAKTKARNVNRTIVKKCKGCRKKLQVGEAAPNWPGCWPCKRALDNVSKLASRQGKKQQQFVKEARADDEKCYNLIQSYLANCPEAGEGQNSCGRKRGTWCLLKYVERVTAASGLVRDKVGEMMWEKLYLEHAQTTRGGKLREEEAQMKWLEWVDGVKRKDPAILFDYMGPDAKLRIWVHTADTMTYRSEYMHHKEIHMEGDSKKKATDEDVETFRPQILQNHGKNMSFDSIGQAMVGNGMDAFSSNDGFLLDVLDLQPDVEMEEDSGKNKTEGPEANKKEEEKPLLWVERDRVVSSTIRATRQQIDTFVNKAVAQLEKQEQAKKEILADVETSFSENYAGEIKMLEIRLEAMDLCFKSKDEEKLKQYIARFSGVPATADEAASEKVEIGQCPPCTAYAKLRPVNVFDALDVKAEIDEVRIPLAQLVASSAKAEKSLRSAKDQMKKQKTRLAAAAVKEGAKNGASQSNQSLPLFDHGVALAHQIKRFDMKDVQEDLDFSQAFVMHSPDWTAKAVSALKADIDGLKATIAIGAKSGSGESLKGFRASKTIAQDGDGASVEALNFSTRVQELFQKTKACFPQDKFAPALAKQAVPTIFGIDAGYDKVSGEACGMACVRLTTEGVRTIVLTEGLQLLGFMERKGSSAPVSVSRQASFFRSMSASLLQEYASECSLYATTLNAGDLLYVPYGAIQGELVQTASYGVRMPLVVCGTRAKNSSLALKRREDECAKAMAATNLTPAIKTKLESEMAVLKDLRSFFNV
ncbi:unnamed protein product [Durusdinium trenchii]|uniref:Uncharacterized protein n=1 Tax=Durusdinium trenchii TaxID=1381693 RepID=A0ABP0JDR6_9DINO